MPVLEQDEVEVLEGEGAPEPTSDDFKLSESATIQEGGVSDDGTVLMHLIRPCVGRGRGKHLYTAGMLEANQHVFAGWKMYLNHLSDQARRALGGLPRDVRDSGGIVQESWWDPDVPAEGRFGQGAIMGRVKPVPVVQELLRVDPRLIEASINATATACKPGKIGDERVWVVEGIESKGSVDWVTEAGAGGRVASIMEALIDDDSAVTGVLDTLDNGTILAWVNQHRPELAEALRKGKKPAEGSAEEEAGESDDDELAEMAKKLLGSGKAKTPAQATALAKQALAKKKAGGDSGKGAQEAANEGDDVAEVTPEMLTEALSSDEGQNALTEAIGPAVREAVKSLDLGTEVLALVEEKLEGDREVIRAEAQARSDRRGELRDMRDHAHKKIDESKLHPILKEQVKARFTLVEGEPTVSLDLVADEDEAGKVEKSAMAKLDEALQEEIASGLKLMGELNPTRVRGQGASTLVEGDGKGKEGTEGEDGEKPDRVGPTTRSLLEANGIDGAKVEEVYARSL